MNLRDKLTKLANDNPDGIREHLVPLLKEAGVILPSAVTNFLRASHRGAAQLGEAEAKAVLKRMRKVKTLDGDDGEDFYLGEFKDKEGYFEDIVLEHDLSSRVKWYVHIGYSMGVSSFLNALDDLHIRYKELPHT